MTTAARHRTGHLEGAPNKRYAQLYRALNTLPVRDRVLIHSIYWDGKSLRQIAREERVRLQAVQNRHGRILRDLKRQLTAPAPRSSETVAPEVRQCARCGAWGQAAAVCSCFSFTIKT